MRSMAFITRPPAAVDARTRRRMRASLGEFDEGFGQAGALDFQLVQPGVQLEQPSHHRLRRRRHDDLEASPVAPRAAHLRPAGDAVDVQRRHAADAALRHVRADRLDAALRRRRGRVEHAPRDRPAPRLPPGNAWSAAPRCPARPVRGSRATGPGAPRCPGRWSARRGTAAAAARRSPARTARAAAGRRTACRSGAAAGRRARPARRSRRRCAASGSSCA